MDMNRTITLDFPGEEIYILGKQHWSPAETISFDVPEEDCISFVEFLKSFPVVNHQTDYSGKIVEKQDQITLVIKETDKEMSPEDIDFVTDLMTEWLIRDYLQKKEIKILPEELVKK